MAFRQDDDPYPLSLPSMDSPNMSFCGPSMNASNKHSFGQSNPSVTENDFDNPFTEDIFSAARQLAPGNDGTTVHPANLSLDSFHTPDSSVSSSSSSGQHNRNASSNSSRSATFDFGFVVPDQMHKLRLEGSKVNGEVPKREHDTMSKEDDVDRQMNELFDFESAANSPGESVPMETSNDKPIAGFAMPEHEISPRRLERPILQPRHRKRPATARSVFSTPSSFKPESSWDYPTTQSHPFGFYDNSVSQDNLQYSLLYGTPPSASNTGFVGPENFSFPQPTYGPQAAMSRGPCPSEPMAGPKLLIHPIPPKTRVETQIPMTMTVTFMPPDITRLHLPARTMAKPKLLAKQKPARSPDMLELDVMPVCASAMKRPGVSSRTLAIARGETPHPEPGQHQQAPFSDGTDVAASSDGKIDPMDGGPINICDGCMMRERKRANRRTEKDISEEDLRWKQGERERIVVFNENEIVDWKPYGCPDLNEPANRRSRAGGRGKKKDEAGEGVPTTTFQPGHIVPYPELAKQVRLLMRITCYCRHQGETEGFQVILTLRDHLGNCVAQNISSPILITDDHKTSSLQNESRPQMTVNGSHLPNGSFFPDAPSPNTGAVPHPYNLGQSQSTLELPIRFNSNTYHPHRSATAVSLNHFGRVQGSQSTGFSSPSYISSYQTSATLTPRNLSRQVSPSATYGPTPKRRKASSTEGINRRPLVDLSMTKMETTDASINREQSPSASPTSSSDVSEGLAMAPIEDRASGVAINLPPKPSPPHSASSTTSNPVADMLALEPSTRQTPEPAASQSMLPQPNPEMAAHAQALRHSLMHLPGAVDNAAIEPNILRIIPSEGPESGGIDITVLGEGFQNHMDVMFGDAIAARTTVLNNQTIICMIPPSYQAGLVRVSLRGWQQPDPPVWFRYIDTDEKDLMRIALAVFYHRNTGQLANASDIARSIINSQPSQYNGQFSNAMQPSQRSGNNAADLEMSILAVIDQIDQTDSAITPRYSLRQSNGQTMLHLAASLGYHRLVAGLLARGMNPNLHDRNGMSALHMACFRGHTKVVRKLLSAGGDPTARSLLGLDPITMAISPAVYQLMSSIANHTRSRSVGAIPMSHPSRASSLTSVHSSWGAPLRDQAVTANADTPFNDDLVEAYRSRPVTPAEVWARSRRNSASDQQHYLPIQAIEDPVANTHLLAAAAAMGAWRDNLAGQIQHFQQSVQRTLPNLQIPNLPPLPNFETYQEHPMVRRISSLVPRMGTAPAPPSYDEIFPEPPLNDTALKKESATRAMGEALMDEKCAANFDRTEVDPRILMKAISEASTEEQQEKLRLARARKVKKLSNDRKLFLIWIPLLILVVIAMMKDWAPQILCGARRIFSAVQEYVAA